MDRVVGHTSIGLTNANASKRENRKTHFTIRSTCEGTLLKTLLDTGATTNYLSSDIVRSTPELKSKSTKIDPVSIRLGNNTVQLADTRVTVDTWIGNKSFRLSYLVMPLPTGIDSIIGMTFFIDHDIWLNPKRKQLKYSSLLFNLAFIALSCSSCSCFHHVPGTP